MVIEAFSYCSSLFAAAEVGDSPLDDGGDLGNSKSSVPAEYLSVLEQQRRQQDMEIQQLKKALEQQQQQQQLLQQQLQLQMLQQQKQQHLSQVLFIFILKFFTGPFSKDACFQGSLLLKYKTIDSEVQMEMRFSLIL